MKVYGLRSFFYRVPPLCGPEDGYQGIYDMLGGLDSTTLVLKSILYEMSDELWESTFKNKVVGRRHEFGQLAVMIHDAEMAEAQRAKDEGRKPEHGMELNFDDGNFGQFIYDHLLNMHPDHVLMVCVQSF